MVKNPQTLSINVRKPKGMKVKVTVTIPNPKKATSGNKEVRIAAERV